MKTQPIIRIGRKVILFFLAFLLFAITPACNFILDSSPATPVPSTPEATTIPPITIGDIQLRLISATKMDSYTESSGYTYTPMDEAIVYLVVRADILSGDLEKIRNMDVSIIDENGSETRPGMVTTFDTLKQVEWPITVARSSASFQLRFPDGQEISLDALLASAPDEPVPPTAQSTLVLQPPTAIPNADAIAGTWSGKARNGDFEFQITVTINKSCAVGSVCGPFDIPSIPCAGNYTLTGISGDTYQLQGGDFQGSCTEGTSDSLQLLSDGTLLYKSQHPSYGESSGVLVKQGNLGSSSTPVPTTNSVIQKNPRKYRVDFVAVLKNDGFAPNKILIYQPRPIAWDGQQDVVIETVSPKPSREGADPVFGNGIYYWNLSTLPRAGESIPIKIQFTFTAYEIVAQIDPNTIQPYNKESPLYKLYTRPETFIESTDPQIVAIANQVASTEENPYLLARKFYDYVIETAHYRLVGQGLLGAKALLTNGEGECGDYASLFIALARAKGIPARSVVGYWAVTGTNQAHVWAEFYLEGVGWIPVDPTIGQQSARDKEYYFGNMDNQRVILEKGFSIPMDPIAPDNALIPLMQGPYWWFWGDGDGNKMSLELTSWNVSSVP